jgi:hypothetical protein
LYDKDDGDSDNDGDDYHDDEERNCCWSPYIVMICLHLNAGTAIEVL